MPEPTTPFRVDVTIPLTLGTVVDTTYRQTSEDGFSPDAPVTVLDLVVAEAARQLIADAGRDLRTDFRRIVRDRYVALIDEAIAPIITDALAQPIQRTNSYGEPAGAPTTLRQLVIDRVGEVLSTKARSSSGDRTMLSQALAEVTDRAIRNELAEALAEAKNQLRAQYVEAAARALADVVAKP